MTNSRATRGHIVLATHEAASTESTITLSFPAIDFQKYSEVLVKIDGSVTLNLELLMQFNGDTDSEYIERGEVNRAGTNTASETATMTSWRIVPDENLDAVDDSFSSTIRLYITKGGNKQNIHGIINTSALGSYYAAVTHADDTITTLTSITILTSTSTWQVGTRIIVYGLKR